MSQQLGTKSLKDGWTVVTKGFKPKLKQPVTVYTNNSFNPLSANNGPKKNTPLQQINAMPTVDKQPSTQDSTQRRQAIIRKHRQDTLKRLKDNEELFFDKCITQTKDERKTIAKENNTNAKQIAINKAHTIRTKPAVGMW